ncbi:MAG: glycosyltransferase [Candidatus Lokiarchaeota archaeon]|nr:glycosyltransferase [Candidatus Lokiarchaeota archaeon]
MSEASVIIRYTNRSLSRARNLKILLDYIWPLNNIEIILSVMEHDIKIKHKKVHKIFSPDKFESAKANNIGAHNASTNIFIFQDADIMFHRKCYQKIINNINSGFGSIRVGERCVNLGENNIPKLKRNPELILRHEFNSCFRDAPGACIALSRKSFKDVGGHCELFKVYGWEDVYFRYKVKKLTSQKCLNQQMIHLPHEINYQMGKQAVNAELYQELLSVDGGDCIKMSNRDREDLLRKYPNI